MCYKLEVVTCATNLRLLHVLQIMFSTEEINSSYTML